MYVTLKTLLNGVLLDLAYSDVLASECQASGAK